MLKRIRGFFSPPVFADNIAKTRKARNTFSMSLTASLILLIGLIVIYIITPESRIIEQVIIALLVVNLVCLILLKLRFVELAAFFLIGASFVAININAYLAGGMQRPVTFFNLFMLGLAAVVYRRRGIILSVVALIIGDVAVYYFQQIAPTGNAQIASPSNYLIFNIIILVGLGLTMQYSNENLHQTLEKAQGVEKDLAAKNKELRLISDSLEKQVAERTASLEVANYQTKRRASQLQAIADVTRSIASIQNVDVLLPSVTNVISENFGFYHVGIFLADEQNEYAILKAANSDGGKKMLANNHRLRIGEQGVVGYAAKTGQPRIALDIGKDAVFFENPYLPSTHSEVALPLNAAGKTIGVLDVQSEEISAFSREDLDVLTTMANQVAIIIENARLFTRTNEALERIEREYRERVQTEWTSAASELQATGYQLSAGNVTPIPQGKNVKLSTKEAVFELPVKLRGETIGSLGMSRNVREEMSDDDMVILQAAADRLALALENARLFDNARRRASRERTIADISNKLGTSTEIEEIMRAAVTELRNVLGASEVYLDIETEEEQ